MPRCLVTLRRRAERNGGGGNGNGGNSRNYLSLEPWEAIRAAADMKRALSGSPEATGSLLQTCAPSHINIAFLSVIAIVRMKGHFGLWENKDTGRKKQRHAKKPDGKKPLFWRNDTPLWPMYSM